MFEYLGEVSVVDCLMKVVEDVCVCGIMMLDVGGDVDI